jgi:hypothetical protein
MFKYVTAIVALAAAGAFAETSHVQNLIQNSIGAAIESEVEAQVAAEAQGIQNCLNKCQNIYNNQQYAINTQQFVDTYEYSACRAGCQICSGILAKQDADNGKCFTICKNTDWLQNKDINGNAFPITKGVVEPDKACMYGCVINTCQFVCQGGTTDDTPTAANADSWWQGDATKGCSIKTGAIRPGGYYSQNAAYNYYNNPSGAGGADACCSNAFSLCNYPPEQKGNTNYKNVVKMAKVACSDVPGAGQTVASMCTYFTQPGNCGNSL